MIFFHGKINAGSVHPNLCSWHCRKCTVCNFEILQCFPLKPKNKLLMCTVRGEVMYCLLISHVPLSSYFSFLSFLFFSPSPSHSGWGGYSLRRPLLGCRGRQGLRREMAEGTSQDRMIANLPPPVGCCGTWHGALCCR